MPKNIVVCCDGTGNEFVADQNSNVVKLYQTLVIDQDQVGYYHPGVGTMGAPNARGSVEKEWTRLLGLGFGYGIMDDIGRAYRFLMGAYDEGDSVYLFGFSRGAYTVRALSGVLHMFGLLHPGNEGLVPYVTDMFARASREHGGHTPTFAVADEFKATFSRECPLHFVGVWDTVSSIGWIYDPVILPFSGRNPIMRTGRQALAIDERRCFFRPRAWGRPYRVGDPGYLFKTDQDLQQVWFAGVHSDVGGSYPEKESGLSKIALEWMLGEASAAGLRLDARRTDAILGGAGGFVKPDPAAEMHHSLRGAWWALEFLPHREYDSETCRLRWTILMGRRRIIPAESAIHRKPCVHESVFERMRRVPDYRPPNLPTAVERVRTRPPKVEARSANTAAAQGRLPGTDVRRD